MGTFGGHALPGSFFIVFGLWWTVQLLRRYFASQRKGAAPFRSSVTFPLDFGCGPRCLRQWEWEGFFKIFVTLVGSILEIITAHRDGRFVHFGNGQHATMYFFFGLSGVVDILVHHRAPLPKDSQHLIWILAFIVEAILFTFHLHGRSQLDTLIHTLLVYTIYSTIVITVVEMGYRNNIAVSLTRAYLVLLQGSWFWQAAFILYNPLPGALPWHDSDHDEIMVVTMMFTWHMATIFIVMIVIGSIIAAVEFRSGCCREVHEPDGDVVVSSLQDNFRLLKRRDVEQSNGMLASSDSEGIDFERPYSSQDKTTFLDSV